MTLALAMSMLIVSSAVSFAAVPTQQTIGNTAPDADGNYTVSVASTDTHSYKVYQILTGTLVAGESKLGNPAWGLDAVGGENNDVKAFIDSLNAENLSNAAINDLVKAQLKSNAAGRGTVDKDHSLKVAPGYYLIVDTTESLEDGDAYSLNLVAVFNNIEITPKKGTTQSDKKVDDVNDSNDSQDAVTWEDSADYDLGDDVPFRLTATIAEDYANYTHGYRLTFHDKQSAGLTFKPETVEVFVDGEKITEGYEVVTEGLTAPETFQIRFANLKDISSVAANSVITVTYKSTLTGDAVVYGNDGNPNTSYVTYSNNPNEEQVGENGKTPDDTVVVFVYKVEIDKVDPKGQPLAGAVFTLEKKLANGSTKSYGSVTLDEQGTKFEFKGLDDGDYILTETTTPTGYNTIAPIEFTVSATHNQDVAPNALKLITLTATGLEKNSDGTDATTSGNVGTGLIKANIVNEEGAELPSTGGIGTIIFYVLGSLLVVGCGIVLISKRRMESR